METCMNSNGTCNCSEASPVFNITKPSWSSAPPTDEPSTTITDIITTLVSNATTSLFTEPTTSSRDEPSTTITDIITTLVSNATTSLLTEPTTSSTVTTEKPEPPESPSPTSTTSPPEEVPVWVWCIVAILVIATTTTIIIIIVCRRRKKKNQSDIASELHYDDPPAPLTLQSQTSKVGLIGTDEPDGDGIKTNSKENETGSYKIVEIEKGGESKDGCNVEFKKAPIVLTTDL